MFLDSHLHFLFLLARLMDEKIIFCLQDFPSPPPPSLPPWVPSITSSLCAYYLNRSRLVITRRNTFIDKLIFFIHQLLLASFFGPGSVARINFLKKKKEKKNHPSVSSLIPTYTESLSRQTMDEKICVTTTHPGLHISPFLLSSSTSSLCPYFCR